MDGGSEGKSGGAGVIKVAGVIDKGCYEVIIVVQICTVLQ